MIICAGCGAEMRCKKNGHVVITLAEGRPVALTDGDLYECPKCGTQVVIGLASKPYATLSVGCFDAWVEDVRNRGHFTEVSQ